MNNFINNLVSRHVETGDHIKPRLRGKFEPPALAENALSPDFNNDSAFITNNTTEPQIIKPGSKPLFPVNRTDNIDDQFNSQGQKPSAQSSAEKKNSNAGNEQPLMQPLLTALSQSPAQLKNENAPAAKPDDTIFTPEVNRVLTNPKTGETISVDKSNRIENGSKSEAPIARQDTNDSFPLDNSDIQTIRTSTDNHWLQSKLTGQTLPADLQWLKTIKQDFNSRNGIQNNQSSTPPVIKVTIGKIEVRAVNQSAPVQTKEIPKPRMTLDDFLKQRNGGKS